MSLTWNDFEKVDMRVGTIVEALAFAKAKKPAYKLRIDFGPIGIKKSSAQITKRYVPEELLGKQVIAVVNFQPKQIGDMMSECLLLGIVGADGDVILLQPSHKATNGDRIA